VKPQAADWDAKSRDVSDVPPKVTKFGLFAVSGSQKLQTKTKQRYYFQNKIKQSVQFAGTAQSSQGFLKN
jgi:hypothetical protein